MKIKENLRTITPILFFLLMLLDGQVSRVINGFFKNTLFFHSHLLLLALIFATFTFSKKYMILTSLILGILMDSYYLGVIGIYALCLPLLVLLSYEIFKYVPLNPLTLLLSLVIFITFLELTLLGVHLVFSFVTTQFVVFITRILGVTLLLNIGFFLILYFPFKKLFLVK